MTPKTTTIISVIFLTIVLALLGVPLDFLIGDLFTPEKLSQWQRVMTAIGLEVGRAMLLVLSVSLAQRERQKEYYIFVIISGALSLAIGGYLYLLLAAGEDQKFFNSFHIGAQIVNLLLVGLEIFLGRLILTSDTGILGIKRKLAEKVSEIDKNIEDYNALTDRKDEVDLELNRVAGELKQVEAKLKQVEKVLAHNRQLVENGKLTIDKKVPLVCDFDGTIIQVYSNNINQAECPTCGKTVLKKSRIQVEESRIMPLNKAVNS